jgi:hypothetical protein
MAIVAFGLLAGSAGAAVAQSTGTFGVVADIHFDPVSPQSLDGVLQSVPLAGWASLYEAAGEQATSKRGSDTNHVLLASALSAIADKMAAADFVLIPGDLLAHRFGDEAPGVPQAAGSTLAQDTHAFVLNELSRALPGKPIFIAIGNNDADCGDYAIEPGGPFLSATLEGVRRAAVGHASADFEKTWRAGGYYEARHPTIENTSILVLNDVLWSRWYENRCGTDGFDAARNQMEWLKQRLQDNEARSRTVWLVHHIPWGIDAYSSSHSGAASCPSGVTPFLRLGVSAELLGLLRKHAGTISASFSAHAHIEDFRLLFDDGGMPALVEKVAPAISPIAGQDPGFLVFTYDLSTGVPVDYTSYRLANLEALSTSVPGDWREAYVFTKAYSQERYSPAAVGQAWEALKTPGAARETYRAQRAGGAGGQEPDPYSCAIGFLDPQSFANCYCADR